jgi:hypothetical protein
VIHRALKPLPGVWVRLKWLGFGGFGHDVPQFTTERALMATDEDLAVANQYQQIMEEAVLRVHAIDGLLRASTSLRPQFIRECCWLQLRMICELVALGCLVCHGDIKATKTKALQKAYEPAKIMSQLESLHPDFYPVPFVLEFPSPGMVHLADYTKPYMTKDALLSLWSKSGNFLHKGSLRKLQKHNQSETLRVDDIINLNQRALNLIEHHKISRLGNNFHFLVNMNHVISPTETKIDINVAVAEGPKP